MDQHDCRENAGVRMNVVEVGYRSLNSYALEMADGYLLIDVGMPGSFGEFASVLRRKGVSVERIRSLVVTHFHPDHCGIAEEVKGTGATLLLGDVQVPHLAGANRWLAKFPGFTTITDSGNAVVSTGDRAAWTARTGIGGVLLHTPGHSDDSVSVVIDGLGAFVGDLRFPEAYVGAAARQAEESWSRIRGAGARNAFPAHGPTLDLESA